MNWLNDKVDNFSTDTRTHYKLARILFWSDLFAAVVFLLLGELTIGFFLSILALIMANIANVKWVMIKQQTNYENIMDKLSTLKLLDTPEVPKPKTNSVLRKTGAK